MFVFHFPNGQFHLICITCYVWCHESCPCQSKNVNRTEPWYLQIEILKVFIDKFLKAAFNFPMDQLYINLLCISRGWELTCYKLMTGKWCLLMFVNFLLERNEQLFLLWETVGFFFCGLNFVVVVDIIYTLTMEKKSHFIDIIFPTFKKRFLFSLPLILLFKFDLRLFFFHFYPPQWIIQSTDDAKVFDHSQIFIEVYWQNKQWHYLATFLPQTKLRLSLRWIKSTI